MKTDVYAVIHAQNRDQCVANLELARDAGCDGVFLISHGQFGEEALLLIAREHSAHGTFGGTDSDYVPCIQDKSFRVGVNLLGQSPSQAFRLTGTVADMLWTDNAHTDDPPVMDGLNSDCEWENAISAREHSGFIGTYFGGVAFKYQPRPSDLIQAGRLARRKIDVLTTSGDGTGIAPEVSKLALLAEGFDDRVAVASGVTAENVLPMLPYTKALLVATGISKDFYNLDEGLCKRLVDVVGSAS